MMLLTFLDHYYKKNITVYDMKRRVFLKILGSAVVGSAFASDVLAGISIIARDPSTLKDDAHIKDYLHRMRNFDDHHPGDIYLDRKNFMLLESSVKRLKRVQRIVGHGNFYLLNFDGAVKTARNFSKVGKFSKEELKFLEMIFYADGASYGFMGEKPLKNMTDRVQRSKVTKIPYTGNYLYKGRPVEIYNKIIKEIGNRAVLTSGVRSVIKQFYLFLNKAYKCEGNLSLASRSLAPPGYSYHGISDFDVGQKGFGVDNFSDKFTKTETFKKLQNLGYIKIRYKRDNLLGVRYEPWHIKVNSLV